MTDIVDDGVGINIEIIACVVLDIGLADNAWKFLLKPSEEATRRVRSLSDINNDTSRGRKKTNEGTPMAMRNCAWKAATHTAALDGLS